MVTPRLSQTREARIYAGTKKTFNETHFKLSVGTSIILLGYKYLIQEILRTGDIESLDVCGFERQYQKIPTKIVEKMSCVMCHMHCVNCYQSQLFCCERHLDSVYSIS